MSKSCVIFGAGREYPDKIELPDGEKLIIAADAGIERLKDHGLTADIIVGDFDSLGKIPEGSNVRLLPCEKDNTDTDEAARIGLEQGCNSFIIYGGTGGRLDHTLANIQLAAELAGKGKEVRIYGRDNAMTVICGQGETSFGAENCGYISVFALSDTCEGVTISGLKYELNEKTLTNTFPIGVSNEFIGKEAFISVRKGTLLIHCQVDMSH